MDVLIQPLLEHCSSEKMNTWLGIFPLLFLFVVNTVSISLSVSATLNLALTYMETCRYTCANMPVLFTLNQTGIMSLPPHSAPATSFTFESSFLLHLFIFFYFFISVFFTLLYDSVFSAHTVRLSPCLFLCCLSLHGSSIKI